MKRRRSGKGYLYYFLHADGYQEPLGKDYALAVEGWKLRYSPSASASPSSFTLVSEAYEKSEAFKVLAASTQRDYRNYLIRLRAVFKHAPMERIPSKAIRKMKKEMVGTKTQFNRMRSLISTLYWWAVDEEELFECPNPCAQVSDYSVKSKKVKVTSAMYYAVYDEAPTVVQDWMDVDVIVGQRVSDTLKLKRTDIDAGKLLAAHGKAGGIVELPIQDDLETVLNRILTRQRAVSSVYLIADENGQRLTYWRLRDYFDDAYARAKAKHLAEGREWIDWKRKDLRTKNATDADSLGEAQERLAHTDSRTTKRHYRLGLKAKPGKLPRR
jgi:hypothetical protein